MIKRFILNAYKVVQVKWIAWLLVVLCMVAIYLFSNMDYVRSWHLTGKTLEVVQQNTEETIHMTYEEEVSHYSSEENEGDMLVLRKLAHVIEYFILGLLCFNGFVSLKLKHRSIYAVALAIIYAVFDEMHQLLVPGRDGSLVDVGIDSIGVILGVVFMALVYKYIIKMEKRGQVNG